MTDAFTQTIAREVASLLVQRGEEIQTVSPNSADGFQLNPQQVLEVMQSNSQWLSQFEGELDQSFQRVANKALDYWLQNTDKEIRDSLKALTHIAEILINRSQDSSFASNSASGGADNTSGNDPLTNALASFAGEVSGSLLEGLFNGGSSTTISESERSRETASHYKASRGQTQAEITKQLGRGTRYT